MKNSSKTKEQLYAEIEKLSNRIAELEKSKSDHKQSDEKYRTIAETIPGVVYKCDFNWTFQFVSSAMERLTGYPATDFINNKVRSYVSIMDMDDEIMKPIFNSLNEAIERKDPFYFSEYKLNAKNGKIKWVYDSVRIMYDENGKVFGYEGVLIDITDRKKAEEKLEMSRERLKALNRIIRHDLSNDFLVIRSAVNIFKRNSDPSMFEEIENRVNKSFRTIANYKKYESFIDANMDLEEMEMTELLENIIKDFPEVEVKIGGKCRIFADDDIYSVFRNLISNAILHGNSKTIDILISSENGICEIRFSDNGKGIPDKIKEKIFDEGFYYGRSGHTGIGLHIVRKTLERYGGSITVEDAESNGAAFIIRLKKVISR